MFNLLFILGGSFFKHVYSVVLSVLAIFEEGSVSFESFGDCLAKCFYVLADLNCFDVFTLELFFVFRHALSYFVCLLRYQIRFVKVRELGLGLLSLLLIDHPFDVPDLVINYRQALFPAGGH